MRILEDVDLQDTVRDRGAIRRLIPDTPLSILNRLTALRLSCPLSPTLSRTGFRKSLNERGNA